MDTEHYLKDFGQTYKLSEFHFYYFLVSKEKQKVIPGTVRCIQGHLFYADEHRPCDHLQEEFFFVTVSKGWETRWIPIIPSTYKKGKASYVKELRRTLFGVE